nr:hypothetical protein HJG63_009130 [Rousettus aegyptiacus]
MSMGFMMLALALCIVLLFTMGLSFWPFLRRLIKVDLVFSFLSFSIVSCPSLAPPECRAPDCPQPDALCSQLRDTKTEATSILPRDRLPVLGLQRLDAVGRRPELLKPHGREEQKVAVLRDAGHVSPVGRAAKLLEERVCPAVGCQSLAIRDLGPSNCFSGR